MAWVSTNETTGSRRAIIDIDNKGPYQRIFIVQYDAPVTDLTVVQSATGLPVLGAGYPSDSDLEVKTIDPQEIDETFQLFTVLVVYEVPPVQGWSIDPTTEDWTLATDVEEYEYILEYDATGAAVVNSATDFFDPALQSKGLRHVINLRKNFATFSLATAFAVQNRVNSVAITIGGFLFPIHTLLLWRWTTPGKTTKNGTDYYPLVVQLKYREQFTVTSNEAPLVVAGWDRAVQDRGLRWLDLAAGIDPKPIILGDGSKAEESYPLDGAGGYLQDDPVIHYLVYEDKDEYDFSTLGLPAALP